MISGPSGLRDRYGIRFAPLLRLKMPFWGLNREFSCLHGLGKKTYPWCDFVAHTTSLVQCEFRLVILMRLEVMMREIKNTPVKGLS